MKESFSVPGNFFACSVPSVSLTLIWSQGSWSLKEHWGEESPPPRPPLLEVAVGADCLSDKLLASPGDVVGFGEKSPDKCCVLSNTLEREINGKDNAFPCLIHT